MILNDIIHRDQVLRAYFAGRNWDVIDEYKLKRELVLNSLQLLPGYPYVIDDEWEVKPGRTDAGRGDLIFTDGKGQFAVVEVKWIDLDASDRSGSGANIRVSRRKKRRKVEEQASEYAKILAQKLGDQCSVSAYIFTDEDELPKCLIDSVVF